MVTRVLMVLAALVAFSQAELSQKQNLENAKKLIEGYNHASRTLEDEIIAQLEMFQEWMVNGNEELGIPILDPFNVDHLEYGTSNEDITFNVAVDGLQVTGLSTFNIVDLDFNVLLLRIDTTLNIPELRATVDHYYLDGIMAGLLPLFGDGAADITIHNLNLTFGAALTTANDQVGLKDIVLNINFDEISGNIENLLGGDLDGVVNDILNLLGPEIFESVEAIVNADVAIALEDYINTNVLEGMTLNDLISTITGGSGFHLKPQITHMDITNKMDFAKQGNANDYLDAILANVREYLVLNGYDNYTLPDQIEGFSSEWIGITWHGEATLTSGFLAGLQTIHRIGDASLAVDGETGTISLNGNLELFDMAAGYDMYVGFMDIGIHADAAIDISSVQVALAARLVVDAGTKAFTVFIDELNITNPGLITVSFHGLGVLDFLIDALGFVVANIFGGLILNAVEGPLQEGIVAALGEILPSTYLL